MQGPQRRHPFVHNLDVVLVNDKKDFLCVHMVLNIGMPRENQNALTPFL